MIVNDQKPLYTFTKKFHRGCFTKKFHRGCFTKKSWMFDLVLNTHLPL